MARLLQIHSDGPGARTALGRLAKPLKSLAGNCQVSPPGVFDGCRRYSGTRSRRCLNRPVGGGDVGVWSACCVDLLLIRLVWQRDRLRLTVGPCWRVQRRQASMQHAHRLAAGAAPPGSQRWRWGGCCGGCRTRRRLLISNISRRRNHPPRPSCHMIAYLRRSAIIFA